MKKVLLSVMAITLMFTTYSCSKSAPSDLGAKIRKGDERRASERDADKAVSWESEKIQREGNRQIGFPNIVNFQEKKLMKMIYELRDQESMITYTYLVSELNGEVGQFLGKSLGYGIPYSTQFSNPQKYFDDPYGGQGTGALVTPQPEPNGLYVPEGLSATWVFLIDENGDPHPTYVEPSIIVSPTKLH